MNLQMVHSEECAADSCQQLHVHETDTDWKLAFHLTRTATTRFAEDVLQAKLVHQVQKLFQMSIIQQNGRNVNKTVHGAKLPSHPVIRNNVLREHTDF